MLLTPDTLKIPCADSDGGGNHQIALYRWGDPNTTRKAFCVHGLTRNARDFDYLASAMAKSYEVLAPDMPGRGKSDRLKEPMWYNYGTYVSDVVQLLTARKLSRVDFIGTSMGGIIGMMLAAKAPDLIGKLVINDIGALIPKDALLRIAQYAGTEPRFSDMQAARAYYADVYAPWNLEKAEHLEHMLKFGIIPVEGGGLTTHYDPNIAFALRDKDGKPFVVDDVDLWEMWAQVKCPVLLLRGANSDLLTREVALEMQKRHPNLTYIEYPDTGHAPSLMRDAQIKEVQDWLNKP